MCYYLQTDDGPELVVEHADRLTFSSGSIWGAYQRIRRAEDGDTVVLSVLRAFTAEIDEVTHADLRESQAAVDVNPPTEAGRRL